MRPGDVILEVNRRAVKARDEFETVLRQQSGESSLLFLVRRREGTRFIALKAK
jgi:hypothetical protein